MIARIKSGLATVRERNPVRVFVRRWHRRLGIVSALFVLVLSITGIMLNHAAPLRLDQRMVHGPLVRALYAPKPHAPPLASLAGKHAAVWIDGALYLDGKATGAHLQALRGAVDAGVFLAVAGPQSLLLFTPDGRLADTLARQSLPGEIVRIGLSADRRLVLQGAGRVWRADAQITAWQPAEPGMVRWSEVMTPVPRAIMAPALHAFAGKGVSAHRLLADVHSGRILGSAGPYLMDGAALTLAALALSGLWLWLRRRRTGGRRP